MGDETLFPTSPVAAFPLHFPGVSRKIFSRIYRIYAHIYHHHFEEIQSLSLEAHLNTHFRHFVFFAIEFGMLSESELQPMRPLIEAFREKSKEKRGR